MLSSCEFFKNNKLSLSKEKNKTQKSQTINEKQTTNPNDNNKTLIKANHKNKEANTNDKDKSDEYREEKYLAPKNYKNLQTPNINKEELLKFVYDLTSQNLTASSFKYAFRNLKNNQKEKEEYLLVNIYKFIIFLFSVFLNQILFRKSIRITCRIYS